MFGKRKDAVKVKNVDALHKIQIRLQPKRCDSDCFITKNVDVTELVKYIDSYNKKNSDDKITYFHAFSCAIAKVIYNRPLLNRFIINKTFYDRKNVSLSFVAKVEFTDNSREVLTVLNVDPSDNVFKIKDKISKRVKKIRTTHEVGGGTDNIMKIVAKLPKPILTFVVWVLKFFDRHDLLPQSFIEDSLYHSTILLSNVGSIGSNSIYHHLTDFGTNSILMTIGKIHKEQVVMDDGKVELRDMCDFGITVDERIADGFYFIKSFKIFEDIMKNPKLLEDNVDEKIKEEN